MTIDEWSIYQAVQCADQSVLEEIAHRFFTIRAPISLELPVSVPDWRHDPFVRSARPPT